MIAIGALGGSGTRAIAEVLIQSGIYMGDDLNGPNDNLVFTRLFKNPRWYKNASTNQKHLRMRLFERYMKWDNLSILDLYELYMASVSNPVYHSRRDFYFRMSKKMFNKKKNRINWGWKEPNTQVYISEFLEYFDRLKYIHVLRHGLDMAFSTNKQQLKNWGWKYNIFLSGNESEEELAVKQLDYWIESTKDVLIKANEYNKRFLLINHSDFCSQPEIEIDRLIEFVGVDITESKRKELYRIPKNTGSNNRFKSKDLSIFESQKLNFVQDMGFAI